MRIEIESLTLTNFKGIKQLQIKFDKQTNISGMNGTGKTTIFDGFLWLLFGKDSTDRKDFGIKTLDGDGNVIPMIEHEVIGKIKIWDSEDADVPRILILKRTLREKWVKPRGQAASEFSGNETVYNVDMVPCTQKEYMDKVDSICKESLFKLLTNPAYFPGLNWAVQRQSLFSLIPTITNDEIMATVSDKAMKQGKFSELLKILNSEKSLEDFRKQISNDKRRLNDELVLIPARIDEVKRGMPANDDWATLEGMIKSAEAFIQRKEEEKSNELKSVEGESSKRAKIQASIDNARQQMRNIQYHVQDGLNEKSRGSQQKKDEHDRYLSDYGSLIQKTTNTLTGLRLDMEGLQSERTKLLAEWKAINAEQYTHVVPGTCPTCGQELPEHFREITNNENLEKWNADKIQKINLNTQKGKNIAGQIIQKQTQIDEATAKIEKLKSDLDAVRKGWEGDEVDSTVLGEGGVSPAAITFVAQLDIALKAHEEYQKLSQHVERESKTLEKLGPIEAVDTKALDKEISYARTTLDETKTKLAKREQIAKAEERKAELEASQKKLSQEIADLEQMEFTIETYVRNKVNMLEERINAMFKVVRFKMFDLQINGQLAETCECSIGGVPYSDLNNAARINAGVDIINTMSKTYGIIAPIWIDNRESVNEIIPTRAQLINLYVTLDPTLIIQ